MKKKNKLKKYFHQYKFFLAAILAVVFFVGIWAVRAGQGDEINVTNITIEKNSNEEWKSITVGQNGVLTLSGGAIFTATGNVIVKEGGRLILKDSNLNIGNGNLRDGLMINGATSQFQIIDGAKLSINGNSIINNSGQIVIKEIKHLDSDTGEKVYPRIMSTGDLTITSGLITAAGEGWTFADNSSGNCLGCGVNNNQGGSYGGFGQNVNDFKKIYGSSFFPEDFGSAGGGDSLSGAGGGIISLSVEGKISLTNGIISANGANGQCNTQTGVCGSGGSGGSIFIDAGELKINSGSQIIAIGGAGFTNSGNGSGGRIAVYYNNLNVTGKWNDGFAVSGFNPAGEYKHFGTIVLVDKNNYDEEKIYDAYKNGNFCINSLANSMDLKLVDSYHLRNGDIPCSVSDSLISFNSIDFDSVHVDYQRPENDTLDKFELGSLNNFSISGSQIIINELKPKIKLTANNNLTIEKDSKIRANTVISAGSLEIKDTSKIDASGLGDYTNTNTNPSSDVNGNFGGGGYGGAGGGDEGVAGQSYGNKYLFKHPDQFLIYSGTAGADGGAGGGTIRIDTKGSFDLSGVLLANGDVSSSGKSGGSGGSIYINSSDIKIKNDSEFHFHLEAKGGNSNDGGAGGGGRVAVYFEKLTNDNWLDNVNNIISVNGGKDSSHSSDPTHYNHGHVGTIYIINPWIETKNGDIYSGGKILANGDQPPPFKYNLSYLSWAKKEISEEFISEAEAVLDNSLYKYSNSEDLLFPQTSNNYSSLVGKINRAYLENNVSVQFSDIVNDLNNAALGGKIYQYNGDGDLSVNSELLFSQSTDNNSGAGTIILIGKNLNIKGDIKYVDNNSLDKVKNIPSVAWMVFKDANGNGGNITIDGTVKKISGIFYAEEEFNTGDGGLNSCLEINGSIIAKKVIFTRTCRNKEHGSEQIINDGRATVNPPPGLEDLVESMPAWREANSSF